MDAERDMLKKYVIPKLEEILRDRRIELKVIDLRWGVDTTKTDENEREAFVLKVCLDSIKYNRPFFVALLGERYGWVPPQNRWENVYNTLSDNEKKMVENSVEKSVTELEIMFGALGNAGEILSRSLFYFRKKESYSNMPNALYTNNYQDEDKYRLLKLLNLKKHIRTICDENNYSDAVREYLLEWNEAKGKFDDVDFCDQIYRHLLKEIEEEITDTADLATADWYEEEENELKNFVYFHTKSFTGRKNLLARLEKFAFVNSQAMLLTGFSGCGKSAVFSKLYQNLQDRHDPSHIILTHSAGLNDKSQHVEVMLQLWNRRLARCLNTDDATEGTLPALKDKFMHLAGLAKRNGYKLIMLLDAIDRFIQNTVSEYMQWLPDGVTLIATSLPDAAVKPPKIHRGMVVESMDLFTEEEARNMVELLCCEINKEIPMRVLGTLLTKQDGLGQFAYASPLWLQLTTNILFGLDVDDFREIRSRSENKEVDKIEGFLCDLTGKFPTEAGELFIEIIKRASEDFGYTLTNKALEYLALSLNGLREKDLSTLLGNDWDELRFASLRRWFGRLLTETGANRQWNLTHHSIVLALRHRLAANERQLHESISSYLLSLSDSDPLRPSALYHLIKAGDKQRFAWFYATSKNDHNRILATYYTEDHTFLDWLAGAAQYIGVPERCDYAEKLIREAFKELHWTDYEGYINLANDLFRYIRHNEYDFAQKRAIGRICQDITLICKHKQDTDNLCRYSQIQVDCWMEVLQHYPHDEMVKNSMAIALSSLGDYYIQIGDSDRAMECFEKLTTL